MTDPQVSATAETPADSADYAALRDRVALAVYEYQEPLDSMMKSVEEAWGELDPGDQRDYLHCANAVLKALGIERLQLMVGTSNRDKPAWGHRWTIGDRVVSVDSSARYPRDIPLFRIRAAEAREAVTGASTEGDDRG